MDHDDRPRQRIYAASAHQPDGDIAEDRVVTAVGSYSASAPLSSAGPWVMQMVAFRAAGSPAPTPTPTPDSYTNANPGSAHLCPRQLCDAAVAPDGSDGAIYGGADRWGSECCHRGMERFDRAGQFTDGLERQRLSVGGRPNGADGLGAALASYLLREEHFGCHSRRKRCNGDF